MSVRESRRIRSRSCIIFSCYAAGLILQSAWADAPKARFNIPASAIVEAMDAFGRQASALGFRGVNYCLECDNPRHRTTHPVVGELAAGEALTLLFEGTDLTFSIVEMDSLPGFKVVSVETRDVFSRRTAQLATQPAALSSTAPVSSGEAAQMLVTGSFIRGVLDLTSPLRTIARDELKSAPYATVQDALQALPTNLRAAQNEVVGGYGNYLRGSGVNLRGLGSNATLVLVNGRRQAYAGAQADFVDLSNLPWSLIDRIEVLPEGISALYGSDAIAGVVNIVLRDRLDGVESMARFGAAEGGGAETVAAQMLGHRWDSGRWFAGYQYSSGTALAASDRAYTASSDKRPFGGRDHRTMLSNPGNILDPWTYAPVFAIPQGQDGAALKPTDLLAGAVNLQNRFAPLDLWPKKRMHSVYLSASQGMGERLEIFGEGRYNRREILSHRGAAAEWVLAVPQSNPFFVNPFGVPYTLVAYNFLDDLGPIVSSGRSATAAGTLGAKLGTGKGWVASLSHSYAQERLDFVGSNYFDLNALSAALADPNPQTAFNPFADGSNTHPATLDRIRLTETIPALSWIGTTNIVADGPLWRTPAGAIKLAVGAEHRQEHFDRTSRGYDGVRRPQQYRRQLSAAFAELSIPLIGNPLDPKAAPRLELSAAGRYEGYSDFGDTYNPKLGLRWAPWSSVKLRTSWGSSFKAPKLIDLHDTTQSAAGLWPFPDPQSPMGYSMAMLRVGSNPDLQEETSTTWTAGLDLAPSAWPGLTFSVTGYAIDYKDQVIQPGGLWLYKILYYEKEWAEAIHRNPTRADIDPICDSPDFFGSLPQCRASLPAVIIDARLRNLAITHVKGLDFKLDRSLDSAWGQFSFGLEGSSMFSFETALTRTSPVLERVDTAQNPLALRLRGTTSWSQRGQNLPGFGVSVAVDYAGDYRAPESPVRSTVDASTKVNLRLDYRTGRQRGWLDDLEFSLNVANLFDEDPPFVDQEWGYDYFNAEPGGRVASFFVHKKW